jgi:hypothetical protein
MDALMATITFMAAALVCSAAGPEGGVWIV